MTKKIISYSLYGTQKKYQVGALRNVKQALDIYPGWVPRIYVGPSITDCLVEALRAAGAEVIKKQGREDASAMFWRFEPFFDVDATAVLVRDADSRLTIRESEAVKLWMESGLGFHIMRDHPAHYCAILGGLWGARTDRMTGLKKLFASANPVGLYGEDQSFLRENVYPIAKRDALIHDSFFFFERSARGFPMKRKGLEFVGEVFDENEEPRQSDRNVLAKAEGAFLQRMRMKAHSFVRGFD